MLLLSKLLFSENVEPQDGPGFSFETFKNIAKKTARPQTKKEQEAMAWTGRTHAEIAYTKLYLKELGAGSSRIVFDLGDNKVLKIAKNDGGIDQNNTETQIWEASKGSSALARIYDYDKEEGKWIVAERLKMLSDEEFLSLTGVHPNIFSFVLDNYVAGDGKDSVVLSLENDYHPQENTKSLQNFLKNPKAQVFMENVAKLIDIFGLDQGDIIPFHFGLSTDSHVKLYDYGFLV